MSKHAEAIADLQRLDEALTRLAEAKAANATITAELAGVKEGLAQCETELLGAATLLRAAELSKAIAETKLAGLSETQVHIDAAQRALLTATGRAATLAAELTAANASVTELRADLKAARAAKSQQAIPILIPDMEAVIDPKTNRISGLVMKRSTQQ